MSDTQHVAGTAREQTGQVADTARQQTHEVAGTAKEQTRQVGETAREEASQVLATATEQASNVLGELTDELSQKADEQASRLGQGLYEVSSQLWAMSENAGEQGIAVSAARQLSEQSERLADRLSQDGTAGLASDVRRYARNNPGSFLLGAAVLGVVAGRLTRGAKDQAKQSSGGRRSPMPSPTPSPMPPPVTGTPVAAADPMLEPAPLLDEPAIEPAPYPSAEAGLTEQPYPATESGGRR